MTGTEEAQHTPLDGERTLWRAHGDLRTPDLDRLNHQRQVARGRRLYAYQLRQIGLRWPIVGQRLGGAHPATARRLAREGLEYLTWWRAQVRMGPTPEEDIIVYQDVAQPPRTIPPDVRSPAEYGRYRRERRALLREDGRAYYAAWLRAHGHSWYAIAHAVDAGTVEAEGLAAKGRRDWLRTDGTDVDDAIDAYLCARLDGYAAWVHSRCFRPDIRRGRR